MVRCKGFSVALFLVVSNVCLGQVVEPRIVVLYPNKLECTEDIAEDLEAYNVEMEITDEIRKGFIQDNLSPSWKMIRTKELEFLQKQDFKCLFSYYTSQQLTYTENNYHDFPLIFPVKDFMAPSVVKYREVAKKYDVDWVINFTRIELFERNDLKMLKAEVQLYNQVPNRIFLTKEYEIDGVYQGVLFQCEAGTWDCVLYSFVEKVSKDMVHQIERNRHHWRPN